MLLKEKEVRNFTDNAFEVCKMHMQVFNGSCESGLQESASKLYSYFWTLKIFFFFNAFKVPGFTLCYQKKKKGSFVYQMQNTRTLVENFVPFKFR